MDLSEERTFQINNVVYVLGSPIIQTETLEQLAYSLSQQDISNRPIVIINPQANTVPNFEQMLENYIENYTAGRQRQNVTTSYAFELSSDDEIESIVSQQFQDVQSPDAQRQISIYKTIRRQSQIKHTIAKYQAEATELWRQHCINPNAAEGSERYAELVYQLMPSAEQELKEISEILANLNSSIQVERSIQQSVEKPVECVDTEHSIDNSSDEPKAIEIEPVSATPIEPTESQPQVTSEVSNSECSRLCLCSEWKNAAVKQMPEQAAKNMAASTNYQKFQAQQSVSVPGYKTVDLWILCQLGIPMYSDGVPIVYTTDGRLQRLGKSDKSVLDSNYWFPKPIFENYFDSML